MTQFECTISLGEGWSCANGCCVFFGFVCPISLALDGEESQLNTIRRFRDEVLIQSPVGQEIIELYYEWSPLIAMMMEGDEAFKEDVKEMIDEILPLIEGVVE